MQQSVLAVIITIFSTQCSTYAHVVPNYKFAQKNLIFYQNILKVTATVGFTPATLPFCVKIKHIANTHASSPFRSSATFSIIFSIFGAL